MMVINLKSVKLRFFTILFIYLFILLFLYLFCIYLFVYIAFKLVLHYKLLILASIFLSTYKSFCVANLKCFTVTNEIFSSFQISSLVATKKTRERLCLSEQSKVFRFGIFAAASQFSLCAGWFLDAACRVSSSENQSG